MADRHLFMLRHAKSDWPPNVPDPDRPLGARGEADAAAVGRVLAAAGVVPGLVVCSPARRTQQTWQLAADAAGFGPVPVLLEQELYEARVQDVLTVIGRVPDDVQTLVVVGHQPTTSATVSFLAGSGSDVAALDAVRDHFPTAGLAELTVPLGWDDLGEGAATLTAFSAPRGR